MMPTYGQIEDHASLQGAGGFCGQSSAAITQLQPHAVAKVPGEVGYQVLLPLVLHMHIASTLLGQLH